MPENYRGMARDVRALAAYVKLLRAGEGVLQEASRLLALYDLTPAQFGALEVLFRSGPQNLSGLEQRILKSNSNLVVVVEDLRKRGLVRRNAGGRGRGMAKVALTPKGRKLVRSALSGHAAAIVSVMARLSPKEQETLGKLCQKLGRRFPASDANPASPSLRRTGSQRR